MRDFDDPIYKELQIKKLSDISNISEQSIISKLELLNKKPFKIQKKELTENTDIQKKTQNISLENDLIRLCFSKNYEIRLLIYDNFNSTWLNDSINKKIFDEVYIHLHSEYDVDEGLIVNNIKEQRLKTQPINELTGGSTFKNPPGYKAWKLIDESGCRGLSIGGAKISDMHTNFIINYNNATANDIETLGNKVKEKVFANSGIKLEWEILRVGF